MGNPVISLSLVLIEPGMPWQNGLNEADGPSCAEGYGFTDDGRTAMVTIHIRLKGNFRELNNTDSHLSSD
jgi:hypothetical protein